MKSRKAERRERRIFSDEFKAEMVRLVEERRAAGSSLAQIAHELDLRPSQLRKWAHEQRIETSGDTAPVETLEQENRRLRREIAVLRQEQAFAKNWAYAGSGAIC